MDIKKLIEEINNLTEDEFVDDFEDAEVNTVVEPVETTTTDELDAKVKISRALDVLKQAIEDFKSATIEEIDLVNDSELTTTFEELDAVTNKVTNILSGNNEATDTQLLDDDVLNTEEDDVENVEEDDEEQEEINFDDEANLDLFGTEEDDED